MVDLPLPMRPGMATRSPASSRSVTFLSTLGAAPSGALPGAGPAAVAEANLVQADLAGDGGGGT